jgi:hypothetical protein
MHSSSECSDVIDVVLQSMRTHPVMHSSSECSDVIDVVLERMHIPSVALRPAHPLKVHRSDLVKDRSHA